MVPICAAPSPRRQNQRRLIGPSPTIDHSSEHDVLAYMTFSKEYRAKLYTERSGETLASPLRQSRATGWNSETAITLRLLDYLTASEPNGFPRGG